MGEYGKLVDGFLSYPPKNLALPDGRTVSNPREDTMGDTGYTLDEVMKHNGFKPLVKADEPMVKEGYYFTSNWVEEENQIVQKWEKVEIPKEPVNPTQGLSILDQEALDILRGVYDDEL